MRLPIRTLGLVAASLLLGTALAPAAAQSQQSGLDGQVALRSDGALYLIANGQRRWIATVAATDDQINALPEGEPIMVGLAPMGSSTPVASTKPSTKPSTSSSGTSRTSTSSSSSSNNNNSDDDDDDSSSDDVELSTDIPITVDMDDNNPKIARGESRKVEIKTRRDVTCELKVRFSNNKEVAEDSKNADNAGRCKYTIEIPSNAAEGDATLIGTVREGGKLNRQEIGLDIKKK